MRFGPNARSDAEREDRREKIREKREKMSEERERREERERKREEKRRKEKRERNNLFFELKHFGFALLQPKLQTLDFALSTKVKI
jgi:hypothetical protein